MIRTIEEWRTVLGKLPTPGSQLVEHTIGERVLGDLKGYRQNSTHRIDDARNLGNAIEAWHQMCRELGI